jgi:DNA-binding response OmpR family regulator
VPVLYYTAIAYKDAKIEALSTCGDGYLKKPVCNNNLKEAIIRLLMKTEDRKAASHQEQGSG